MNNTVKNILGILLSILLCVIIFFEFKTGFDMLHTKKINDVDSIVNVTKQSAIESVVLDEVTVYEEIPEVVVTGDVIQLSGYTTKIKLNGSITDDTMAIAGNYIYSSSSDSRPLNFRVECRSNNMDVFRNAVSDYWHGKAESLLPFCNISVDSGDVIFYQNTFREGNAPVIYLGSTGSYYMFLEFPDSYLVLTAPEPFSLTSDKVTVHFSNP